MTDDLAVPKPDGAAAPASDELFAKFVPHLRRSSRWRTGWGVSGAVMLLAAIGATWFMWFWVIPALYRWGFQPPTWTSPLAVLGILLLCFLPFALLTPGFTMVGQAVRTSLESLDTDVNEKLDVIRNQQRTVEQELEELEHGDTSGLMHLIRYSRLQLEAYYTVGLRQTQQSYRNSVIAMWLGFAIIMIGVLRQFIPLNNLYSSLPAPSGEFDPLVLVGGAVVEFISALFLWVYKSSIEQLTYFYDRQMHLHGVLLSHKIASGMVNPDDTKKSIVDDILAKSWRVERSPLRDAQSLKDALAHESAKT